MAKVKKNKTYPGVSDIFFMIQFKSEENCAEVFFSCPKFLANRNEGTQPARLDHNRRLVVSLRSQGSTSNRL